MYDRFPCSRSRLLMFKCAFIRKMQLLTFKIVWGLDPIPQHSVHLGLSGKLEVKFSIF